MRKLHRMGFVTLVLLIAVGLFPGRGEAAMLELSLEQLTAEANTVVLGTVGLVTVEPIGATFPGGSSIKYTVAALLWLSVVAYLGLAGRRRVDLATGRARTP